MKSSVRQAVAALFAATAASLAAAQGAPAPAPDAATPTPVNPLVYVQAPVASIVTGNRGPNVEVANAIVQALGADPSLKGSKLTVAAEEQRILLTGVAPKLAQMSRAVQIATEHAGEGNVSNAIVTEEVFIEAG